MADREAGETAEKPGDDGRLPILIGISGQRFFDKNSPEENKRIAADVREALAHCFEKLDEESPNTPKVLVTGGAMGTDLLAVEAALERSWRVVLLLAFDNKLFLEDFEPPETPDQADADRWNAQCTTAGRRFSELVDAGKAGVIVRTLPSLADRNGGSVTDEKLSKASAALDRTLRREHYEQVGQWIAEAATMLVAVTSEPLTPAAEATGGTIRVIAHRRLGRPIDDAGLAVARRSSVLRSTFSPALPPPGKPAWLIDPRELAAGDHKYGVQLLAASEGAWPVGHGHDSGEVVAPHAATIHSSLALVRGFERLNGRLDAAPANRLSDDPLAAIRQVRTTLDPFTARSKRWSHLAFWLLAIFFVTAVFAFEIYAKFLSISFIFLVPYLVILALIGLVALMGRWRRWQPDSEDYRAVSEMLRVQRVWWSVGLPNRVDREHLQGVDHDLAPIRDATTTILSWVWLRSPWQKSAPTDSDGSQLARWEEVRQGGATPRRASDLVRDRSPADWIGSQIRYFSINRKAREKSAHRTERLSWFLFITGGLLAALLCAWLASPAIEHPCAPTPEHPCGPAVEHKLTPSEERPSVPTVERLFEEAVTYLGWASAPLGLAVFLAMMWVRNLVAPYRRGVRGFWLSVLFAVPAAAGLMLGSVAMGKSMAPYLSQLLTWLDVHVISLSPHDVGKSIAIVTVVILNAVAGAWRFLAEKLGWEAEALAFRDAAAAYMTAEASLAADWDATGKPRDAERARSVVYSLGHLALKENEAWLKMRRERPLTPVSG